MLQRRSVRALFFAALCTLSACQPRWLEVSPKVLSGSGQKVQLSWASVARRPGDWIGIFDAIGGQTPLTQHINITVSQRPEQAYELYNLRRGGFIFKYFRESGELIASSEVVSFAAGDHEPTALHVALAEDPRALRVMWQTARPDTPVVLLPGGGDGDAPKQFEGNFVSYGKGDLCQEPWAWQEPGWTHVVELKGLEPGRTYSYSYGNRHEGEMLWARDQGSFTLPPAPGDAKPFDMVVVGDMGFDRTYCKDCTMDFEFNEVYQDMCGLAAQGAPHVIGSVLRKLQSQAEPMIMAHIGDLAYACTVEAKWDYWMQAIKPVASRMPYMVSIGNHEYGYRTGAEHDPSGATEPYRPFELYDNDSFGECAVPTVRRFHMPTNGNSVFWYSFESGLLHVVILSFEHEVAEGSVQRQWLEADLASVDRQRTPWLVVMSHRPLYCSQREQSAIYDYEVGLMFASQLDDLFAQHRVNVYLAGHYHSYERTCPIYKGVCRGSPAMPGAPIHVTVGTGGIDVDRGTWDAPWSVKHIDPAFGYGFLSVQDARALRWRYVNVTTDGKEAVLDDVWIGPWGGEAPFAATV